MEHTTELVSGFAGVAALADAWGGFEQAALQPLLAHDWTAAALASQPAHEPRVVLVRRGAHAAALAPLVEADGLLTPRLEIAGARSAHEPSGLLYLDTAALEALCAKVISLGRPLLLQRLPACSAETRTFTAAAKGRGILLVKQAAPAPFVSIDRSWDSFQAGLSARRRQDYRRARRRLEREGAVTLDIRAPTPDTVAADLAEAKAVEQAGWKGRKGSAIAKHAVVGAFFDELARRHAARGTLRVCFLRVAGAPVATQICLEDADRWWVLKIGYDERWAAHSPGIQLMWEVLRHAFERRLASVELLGTAEPWLSIWTTRARGYQTLGFYPWSFRGLLGLAGDSAIAIARKYSALVRR